MNKKVYTGKCAEFQYYDDMSGNIEISVAGGGKVTVPASDIIGFVSHNIVNDNSSIMHAIVHSPDTEITRLNMSFDICRTVDRGWNN